MECPRDDEEVVPSAACALAARSSCKACSNTSVALDGDLSCGLAFGAAFALFSSADEGPKLLGAVEGFGSSLGADDGLASVLGVDAGFASALDEDAAFASDLVVDVDLAVALAACFFLP